MPMNTRASTLRRSRRARKFTARITRRQGRVIQSLARRRDRLNVHYQLLQALSNRPPMAIPRTLSMENENAAREAWTTSPASDDGYGAVYVPILLKVGD